MPKYPRWLLFDAYSSRAPVFVVFFFVLCLVFPMLAVSLDCPFGFL